MLVVDFEMADKQLTDEMNDIIDSIDFITSIEKINEYSMALQRLSKAFIDQRKQRAEVAIVKLNEMLKSIVISPISQKLGEIKYSLKLGDKIITAATNPKVTSNCAKITDIINNTEEWIIKYDYSGCYDDPSNAINVAYNVSPSLKKAFYFDINANKAEIMVREELIFSGGTDESDKIKGAKCSMTIYSKFNTPLTIEKVTLNWDNYPPVVIDNINFNVKGKGEYVVDFVINQSIDKSITSYKKQNMISGVIQFRNAQGELMSYKMYNQPIKTEW